MTSPSPTPATAPRTSPLVVVLPPPAGAVAGHPGRTAPRSPGPTPSSTRRTCAGSPACTRRPGAGARDVRRPGAPGRRGAHCAPSAHDPGTAARPRQHVRDRPAPARARELLGLQHPRLQTPRTPATPRRQPGPPGPDAVRDEFRRAVQGCTRRASRSSSGRRLQPLLRGGPGRAAPVAARAGRRDVLPCSTPARPFDVTGCGNSLDFTERRVVQFALDSLRHWVTEYGVDGFRFDS